MNMYNRQNPLHNRIRDYEWDFSEIEKDYYFVKALASLFPKDAKELEPIARRLIKLENERNELLKKFWDKYGDEV
jgi:hypothetical protein